jgi:ATPase subunit of ABC transporter with duplicated ATPase domains
VSVTAGAAETEALGGELAAMLEPGDVVVVSGEVGAGKTTLIRGACRALGIEDPVTSPTFTIGQRYQGGRLPVAHLDLYRLESLEAEDPARRLLGDGWSRFRRVACCRRACSDGPSGSRGSPRARRRRSAPDRDAAASARK